MFMKNKCSYDEEAISLAWPKSCIIKLCIFSLLMHSIFHTIRGSLLGPYPYLASPWAKKRLLITSSSWPKKLAWVKLGWRFLGLGFK
jgi:hypothetical protein